MAHDTCVAHVGVTNPHGHYGGAPPTRFFLCSQRRRQVVVSPPREPTPDTLLPQHSRKPLVTHSGPLLVRETPNIGFSALHLLRTASLPTRSQERHFHGRPLSKVKRLLCRRRQVDWRRGRDGLADSACVLLCPGQSAKLQRRSPRTSLCVCCHRNSRHKCRARYGYHRIELKRCREEPCARTSDGCASCMTHTTAPSSTKKTS